MLADPASNPWLLRLAVLRETGEIVGYGNFYAPPDADGMVEIGYSIVASHRGQGYATEVARTSNAASIAIIEGVGEQVDDEDGLELIYEIAASDYRG